VNLLSNPLLQKFATNALRSALKVAGPSIAVYTDDELSRVAGAVLSLIGFAWGLWKDFKEQQKLATALATMPTSQKHLEELIKGGEAASAATPKDRVPA